MELGIRPNEVIQLKIEMIKGKFFRLPPEITKTKRARLVPITEKVRIRFPDLSKYPSDFYLFGTAYKKAYGVERKFVPSATKIGHNAANNFWREELRKN